MATTKPSKHKNPLPPPPRSNVNPNGTHINPKPSKRKKRTPPISPSLSQSSSICKPSKPHHLKSSIDNKQKPPPISSHKPPSIPSTKRKTQTKKAVPPPPINRSSIKPPSPIKPNQILTRESSHSFLNENNTKNKRTKPPKQSRSLTKESKNKNKTTTRIKCKPPPLPKQRRIGKHQKAHSVQIIGKIPLPESPVQPICKPIFEHPTIGEFYSARVHKKKLLQRQLPSKPENVNLYFILMGKLYKYILNICLEHKLSQLLPKLSIKLAGNEEILHIITCESGRNGRSLSSISKKINNGHNNNIKIYDSVIKDPIFIYKNNTYNSSLTFTQIGYKNDLNNYIVILSCRSDHEYNTNTSELISLTDISHTKNGHFRSKTTNDIPINDIFNGGFNALSNVLNIQRDYNSRYNDIKQCVFDLGYTSLGIGITKLQLINYIHTFIINKQNEENDNCLQIINKPKRKRARSRSCSGLPNINIIENDKNKNKNKNNEKKFKKRHSMKLINKRYNQSMENVNNNNSMIRLDLSCTNPTKLEFNSPNNSPNINHKIESKFSRLFRKSLSKNKNDFSPKSKTPKTPKTPVILSKKKKDIIINENIKTKSKTKTKPRKYRAQKEINIGRKIPPPPPNITQIIPSNVKITRRTSKQNTYKNQHKMDNVMRAAIIVKGHLNTNIGNNSKVKWKKYYYTFNKDRILCSYLTKDCDLSLPIESLSLIHGKCSFNIKNNNNKSLQTITITVKTSKKTIVKHFRGSIASLEKWKRAFLF